jgi:hypothetical protein
MARIEQVDVSAFTVPTDFPESDGTLEWDATTLVVVEIAAGGQRGLGYTYADGATAGLIREYLISASDAHPARIGSRFPAARTSGC